MSTYRDLYQDVTNSVIDMIEADPGRWTRPWATSGIPFNATTGKDYRGVNILLLWGASHDGGFKSNAWASYKQWQKAGAQVRKGERGSMIVFYRQLKRTTPPPEDMQAEETAPKSFSVLRYFTVFNADQVDGYAASVAAPRDPVDSLASAEDFIANTAAKIDFGQQSAFYVPAFDFIGMPDRDAFIDTETGSATVNYYSTLLHELTHWTGNAKRLDRDMHARFGDDAYAAEELIAELGAAFLAAALGIESAPRADHAQYLSHWLRVLRADKKAIITAAARASDAAAYLESLQFEGDDDGQPVEVIEGSASALPATVPATIPAPVAANLPAAPGKTSWAGGFGRWYTSWKASRTRAHAKPQPVHDLHHAHPLPPRSGSKADWQGNLHDAETGADRLRFRAAQWAAWNAGQHGIDLAPARGCDVEPLDAEDAAFAVTFTDADGEALAQVYVPRWPDEATAIEGTDVPAAIEGRNAA